MAWPHTIDTSDFAIRKDSFNPNKGRLSIMNLRSPGPVAAQTIIVKVKCRVPFSEPSQGSVRDSLPFQNKMGAIKFNFHVSFRVIVAMLQHRPFQNIKTDGNEFKMFNEKECNILINPH